MKDHRFASQNSSRRDVLKALATAGAAAMIPGREMFGQFVNKSTAKGGRIDVHHHHAPPALRTGTPGRGRGGYGPWTPELSLEMMEKFDIAVARAALLHQSKRQRADRDERV
jgi:hypothetical protein